jgi:voltage-gated potassium channel
MTAQSKLPDRRSMRWLEGRIARKGLRVRYAAYVIVAFWATAIIAFGIVEHHVDSTTFKTPWLGMWWATQTVTTVGYGDIVPQQTAGKVIAVFLMLGGLSLLSVVTAAVTSAFVARAEEERQEAGEDPVMRKLGEVAAQLEELKSHVEGLERGRTRDPSA